MIHLFAIFVKQLTNFFHDKYEYIRFLMRQYAEKTIIALYWKEAFLYKRKK